MKQTAVGELIEYFVKQQKEGCSHWCIHDLIAQLYVSKEMEKEQIIEAYHEGQLCILDIFEKSLVPMGFESTSDKEDKEDAEQYYRVRWKNINLKQKRL